MYRCTCITVSVVLDGVEVEETFKKRDRSVKDGRVSVVDQT